MLKKRLNAAVIALVSSLSIFAGEPAGELLRLTRENRELRKKLLDAEKEIGEYRLWLGSLTVDHRKMLATEREKRSLFILDELAKRGNSLSISALAVHEECRKLLAELPLGPVRKAQVELRLDELERAAGAFAALTVPSDSGAGNSRILAVDKELKVVVLSAGAGAGVFPGMIFSAKSRKNLKLRVIAVRFDGALAEIVSGRIHEFVPGMEMSALHHSPTVKSI